MYSTLREGELGLLIKKEVSPKIEREDIIVFTKPRGSESINVVKRVIGLPGETIEINIMNTNGKNYGVWFNYIKK